MPRRKQAENRVEPPTPPKVDPKLIANVTVKMPNRKMTKGWQPGLVIKPGNEIPLEGLDKTVVERWLNEGSVHWSHEQPRLQDVRVARPEPGPVVGSKTKSDDQNKFGSQGGQGDPVLQAKLAELAAEQAERGVEDEEPPVREIEVNTGTGEMTDTGDPDDEGAADAQVS